MTFAALAAAALAAPAALWAMPPADAWQIGPVIRGKNYSVGMPARPASGPGNTLVMDFPLAGAGQVDALTTAVRPLDGARQIVVRYRIEAARGVRFVADEAPDEPATVSLYFQRAGDNWSGRGRYQSYRWYSPVQAVVPLTPGEHTIAVRFDERWTDVHGASNSDVPGAFAAALQETRSVGIAFGSRSLRSHGVYATGPARFVLLDFDIR
jgi:hypothetical protein